MCINILKLQPENITPVFDSNFYSILRILSAGLGEYLWHFI